MKNCLLLAAVLVVSCLSAKDMTFTADQVAVDNVTKSAVATGHVEAVYSPYRLTSESLRRDADGTIFFHESTCATTCTNEVGHTHWNIAGSIEYKADDHVLIRNACLRFCEIPVMYLPYLWYPLNWSCGFQWMPGYTGRWGAFILTRYSYDIAGDPAHQDNTWWLKGSTNFDLRYKNGIALGEDLKWNLGDFGAGDFRIYYAWDQNADRRYDNNKHSNWGSSVNDDRYLMTLNHKWQATERDSVRVRGAYNSDSYVIWDFMRKNFFDFRNEWQTFDNSGVFWEHLENAFAFGVEASGRLNDFYGSTDRLPEAYFDLNPMPVFGSPVIYESQNRLGYLQRRYAEFDSSMQAFASVPGLWADYETLRFDTYHRFSVPFRVADDIVSVVPRVGYHGTFWNDSGMTDIVGDKHSVKRDGMFRSIGEVGATFAARGEGWVNDSCAHVIEPYIDVLAQKAWYNGRESDAREYVFDNIDSSLIWEDEFAGRGRNLPYTYYGVTPGVRNLWSFLKEDGSKAKVIDFDIYSAVMFNENEYYGSGVHKLPKPGCSPYGKNDISVMPGVRLRWTPADDISLFSRAEYDSDNNRLAVGDLGFSQRVTRDFKYSAAYNLRDYRYWDFSSMPEDPGLNTGHMNKLDTHSITLKCEYQPIDWLALGPFVRWDVNDNELDAVGSWIDYMTDCLGFRLLVKYQNEYTRVDGYHYRDSWDVGFYVYLRAFGADSGSVFGSH